MPKGKTSVALLALGTLLCSCGKTSTEPPLTCDSGEEIVFGYQVAANESRLLVGTAVMVENGDGFLFVDGACQYWAYRSSAALGYFEPLASGRLTSDQVERMNLDLMERDWEAIASRGHQASPAHDGGIAFFWRDGKVGTCEQPCFDAADGVVAAADAWISELQGTSSSPSPSSGLRWTVMDVTDIFDPAIMNAFEWTGVTNLSEVALSPLEGSTESFGDHALVPPEDQPIVEALLERLRAGELGDLSGGAPFYVVQAGRAFLFAVRSVLPFEDERGLVRPPSPSTEN